MYMILHLCPAWQQSIAWTDDGHVWSHMPALGVNELNNAVLISLNYDTCT